MIALPHLFSDLYKLGIKETSLNASWAALPYPRRRQRRSWRFLLLSPAPRKVCELKISPFLESRHATVMILNQGLGFIAQKLDASQEKKQAQQNVLSLRELGKRHLHSWKLMGGSPPPSSIDWNESSARLQVI